ncbi:MAG: SDR family NAD(P)-dependent oxidoreductase [Anaerovoracaceae bacterium]
MKKYVLVTGTSGGIGKAVALRLLEAGYDVFGCNRRTSAIEHPQFHPVVMDISREESVEAAFEEISRETDHLDAVINISGIMFMGSLLEEPEGRLEQIMNVNLLGMSRVNRVFFPMIEKGHGRILNFSSEYGTYAVVPFNGFYTTSKHAVESYSDGLRRELKYIGIPVITIRPGAFRTEMEQSTGEIFQRITENSVHFRGVLEKMRPLLLNGTKNAKDPDEMAKVVLKAVTDPKPKIVYSCNHNLGVKLMSVLPEPWIDQIFYRMFQL